jgi:RHH-type transcriptional regulator, proline utilization regulon repressor / proline dehydrogenase / delta 1-pyrroline-5-carboxylate dehydrogenase
VVDSSALAEQVVTDVLTSAFDSAGQRCSALRLLCLQDDIADRTLAMLKGAMAELTVGNPDRLATDVGPVISAEARDGIIGHIEAMRKAGHPVYAADLPATCAAGTFVAPTLIELGAIGKLTREVFGPVLHVVRYRRDELEAVMDAINSTGYGLTFGLHTRLDETIAHVVGRVHAGNVYVNRNVVGAVVGVQPFGGHGLSGTGPKAGGPMYLRTLVQNDDATAHSGAPPAGPLNDLAMWLRSAGEEELARRVAAEGSAIPDLPSELPGPVGEANRYTVRPRGQVLARVRSRTGMAMALAACLATRNTCLLDLDPGLAQDLSRLPESVRRMVALASENRPGSAAIAAALFEGDADGLMRLNEDMADRDGAIVPVFGASTGGLASGRERFPLERLLEEVVVSTNTAAAGGNASLMTIG